MRDVTSQNFGLLISYLLPGLTVLWGASYFSPALKTWLGGRPADAPTIAGFLYVTLAALGAGMAVSTVRWILVDRIHHWTGIRRPDFDYARLEQNIDAYDVLVRHHYEYYKFHSNGLVAVAFTYLAHRTAIGFWSTPISGVDLGFVLLAWVLFVGSRDNLKNYFRRVEMSLGSRAEEAVTSQNGSDSCGSATESGNQELTKPADSLH